jgi:hypothetical protein
VSGGQAQSAAIGPAGGSVSVTVPGGKVATLLIPAGALAQATTITLTPLASAGHGLPGRLVGGVQMTPAGLPLARVATLKLSHGGSAGFEFDSGGRNLHLLPIRGGGVPVSTLAGAGELSSSKGNLRSFAGRHVAADALSQLEQLVVTAGGRSKRASVSRGAPLPGPELFDYVQATAYQIEAEGEGDFLSALALYGEWQAVAQSLTEALPGLVAQVKSALIADAVAEILRDQAQCEGSHDLSIAAHMLAIANGGTALGSGAIADAANQAISHCFQFDVLIDSQVHFDASRLDSTYSGGYDWHYTAGVPVDLHQSDEPPSPGNYDLSGSRAGKYESATGSEVITGDTFCNGSDGTSTSVGTITATDPGSVDVSRLTLSVLAQGVQPTAAVALNSSATETYHSSETGHCPSEGDATIPLWWTDVFATAIGLDGATADVDGVSADISLDPPTPEMAARNPALIAQKTLAADDGGGYSGQTTIQMVQDPGHLALPPP